MSWTLFKASFRMHWKIVLIVSLVIMMYVTISISMYDPNSVETLTDMLEMLPEGMMKAMGFDGLGTELTSYLSNYLFGFIMILFPLITTTVLANGLVAKKVDSGSMSYLLSTPNKRTKIVITQVVFMLVSITFMFAINLGVAIVMCEVSHSGMLDIQAYINLNLVTYLVTVAIGGISFLASCIFGDSKSSLSAGVGIPVMMLVAKMLSEFGDKLEFLRYVSFFSFTDVDKILGGETSYVLMASLVLIGVSILLYGASVFIFNKRSLVI